MSEDDKSDRATRLAALLGSRNALVREEAANALGHFPLTNQQICGLILQYLRNPSWDTRIAASNALRSILDAMPKLSRVLIPNLNRLSSLNVFTVVHNYYPLLSCESELLDKFDSHSFGDQRKLVDEELQLQSAYGVTSDTFITDDDFLGRVQESSTEQKLFLEADPLSMSESESMDDLDCAVQRFCMQLLATIADARWEHRHGAALALNCVLSLAYSRLTPSLVDSLATRLVQTLTLDHFIDFASGRSAVGPVRETVSECIALLLSIVDCCEFHDRIARHISSLMNMNDESWLKANLEPNAEARKHFWFQRQAAMLVLKYHFAGPRYQLKFEEFFALVTRSFSDTHDEVTSAALSAVTTLFCKDSLSDNVRKLLCDFESVIYRFIEASCEISTPQKFVDIDTVIVDLLTLLQIWLNGNGTRAPPYSVLVNLARLLNPLHVTRSLKIIRIFSMSYARPFLFEEGKENSFDECSVEALSSLLRIVLFASPFGSDELLEACIACAYHIAAQFRYAMRLPYALAETIGRWSSCLLLDAKNAEIDVNKYHVGGEQGGEQIMLLCGDEIRTLSDVNRINALMIRKLHIARFLAPIISAVHEFPSKIGDQSLRDATELLIVPLLNSPILMHRLGGALLTHSWVTCEWITSGCQKPPLFLMGIVKRMVLTPSLEYDDEKFFFHYLDSAYKEFLTYCRKKGVTQETVDKIEECGGSIDTNAKKLHEACVRSVKSEDDVTSLNARYGCFENAVSTAKAVMTSNVSRINALLVSSLLICEPKAVLESSSLNPFIKPLMELLRFEDNTQIARHLLNALPVLFRMTAERKPSPHAKMVRQLVNGLVSCETRFPRCFPGDCLISNIRSDGKLSARSQNSELALRALTSPSASTDLNSLLDFRLQDSEEMTAAYIYAYSYFINELRKLCLPQPIGLLEFVGALKDTLSSGDALVRYSSAQCISQISLLDGLLRSVLEIVIIPLQNSLRSGTASAEELLGLAELLLILSELGLQVIGGLRVLAPLSLRLMADQHENVREASATAFRNYVPLMVLKTAKRRQSGERTSNDKADDDLGSNSIDLLLGDPSRLPPLSVDAITGLDSSVSLRHYQQEGVRWMCFLEEYGLNGILADDMGLGKTLQTLCLIAVKAYGKPSAKVLIVSPPTLISHWCSEWKQYFPSLPPFHKVDEGMKDTRNFTMKNGEFVTVVSYNTIRSCTYFQEVEWFYVILDEGHVIRNPMTQLFKAVTSLKCRNRLILSGTPVQNTPADLWALFQFLMPGYLGSMKQFRISFLRLINACRNVNASTKEIQIGQDALDRLHKAVLPFVMRRLKADVLKDLPEKIVQDYMCTMTESQRELYVHIINQCNTVRSTSRNHGGISPLETIAELRKCIVHPSLVSAKIGGSHSAQGTIEESGKMIALRELLQECGIGCCSQSPSYDEIQPQGASEAGVLPGIDQHRALIFCQRIATVQLIANMIDSRELGTDIRYLVLDGTIPASSRHSIAEKFNLDPGIDILLLTTSVGGEGLNLTGADVVIFVEHDWNPVKDLQAMDRAHRIGQRRTVNVYRLITEASIEQKIMRYQKFKTDTANALVGADNRSLQTMATEQLVELFALDGGGGISSREPQSKAGTKTKKSAEVYAPDMLDPSDRWDLEELWDQSQYDRYNAVNLGRGTEESESTSGIKRQIMEDLYDENPPSKVSRPSL